MPREAVPQTPYEQEFTRLLICAPIASCIFYVVNIPVSYYAYICLIFLLKTLLMLNLSFLWIRPAVVICSAMYHPWLEQYLTRRKVFKIVLVEVVTSHKMNINFISCHNQNIIQFILCLFPMLFECPVYTQKIGL